MKKQIKIADDFEIIDFDFDNQERYEFTKKTLDPEEELYSFDDFETFKQINTNKLTSDDELKKQWLEEFKEWTENNLTFEELYEIPMMNTLYYYPSFINFSDSDRKLVDETTTLLYDTELEQWAVGMTGGGMDLTPHLADTFIKLQDCIPDKIAQSLNLNYSAYVNEKQHKENCQIVAKAFLIRSKIDLYKAQELGIEEPKIKELLEIINK